MWRSPAAELSPILGFNPLELVLHRVLDGDDLEVGAIDLVERRVEGGGLAGAGGAGDEEDAVRSPDQSLESLRGAAREAEAIEGQEDGGSVEQPHHDGLAVDGRHGGDADVDPPAVRRDPDAPVLGQAALGDIHLGHDLDARGERGPESARGSLLIVEQPVDTVADVQAVLEGLDVDVGSFGGQRPVDQDIDQPHHRRLERHVPEAVHVFLELAVAVAAGGSHALDDLLQRGVGPVRPLDGLQNRRGGGNEELDRHPEALLQIVQQQRIGRLRRRHRQHRALHGDRTGHVLTQVLGGEVLERRGGRRQLLAREERQPLLLRHRPQHIGGSGGAQGDQHLPETPPLLTRLRERFLEGLPGNNVSPHEDFAQWASPGECSLQGTKIMGPFERDRQPSRRAWPCA